ncbi:MAG: hypothetical protein M3R30_04370, partial [Candidatus Eremiobacteraeota bacterium]|nr:hypothetical protein [Candidatus Eremiobacteraeota bacterium]
MSGFTMGLRAAVSAALLVCLGAAAPTGTLPSGVVYELRPDPAQSAAAVALWYRAPAGGFDNPPGPGL